MTGNLSFILGQFLNTTQRYQFGLNALVIEVYLPLSVCLGLHLPFLCLASVIFLTLESYFECLFFLPYSTRGSVRWKIRSRISRRFTKTAFGSRNIWDCLSLRARRYTFDYVSRNIIGNFSFEIPFNDTRNFCLRAGFSNPDNGITRNFECTIPF